MEVMDEAICPYCSVALAYSIGDVELVDGGFVLYCPYCKNDVLLANPEIENIQRSDFAASQSVLEIGTLVSIVNKEHPWYKQLGLIKDIKHKHYRIEVFGKLIWMPVDWVATT